jgi:hypothetical protein
MRKSGFSRRSEGRSVLHTDTQLAIGFVNRPDGVYAVAAEVVCSLLEVVLGTLQGTERILDFRVFTKRWRRRGQRQHHCDQGKGTHHFLLHNSS